MASDAIPAASTDSMFLGLRTRSSRRPRRAGLFRTGRASPGFSGIAQRAPDDRIPVPLGGGNRVETTPRRHLGIVYDAVSALPHRTGIRRHRTFRRVRMTE